MTTKASAFPYYFLYMYSTPTYLQDTDLADHRLRVDLAHVVTRVIPLYLPTQQTLHPHSDPSHSAAPPYTTDATPHVVN